MNAVAIPKAMNSYVKSNLSKGDPTFQMGYMPMTTNNLEKTLQRVSNEVSMNAQQLKMSTA